MRLNSKVLLVALGLVLVSAGCSNQEEAIEVDPITLEPLPTIEEKQFQYFRCVEVNLASGLSEQFAKKTCVVILGGLYQTPKP